MITLPYKAYSPSDVEKQALTPERIGDEAVVVRYVGASPFEIPQHIDVEVLPRHELAFRFIYPNDEPVDTVLRKVTDDGSIQVRLSHHTKTIVELRVSEAEEKLFGGDLSPDRNVFASLLQDETPDVVRTSLRNLDV